MSKALHITHVELKEANAFVLELHRHHKPVPGHRFSVGVKLKDKLVGVAIVGRPVARMSDQYNIIEVVRLCTDGTKNACSILYATVARAGQALGYKKVQTFILETEPGTSLKAAGWVNEGISKGGSWSRPSRGRETFTKTLPPKVKWGKELNE